jgi:hypothetical protein
MPQERASRRHANFSLLLWTRSLPTLSMRTSRRGLGLPNKIRRLPKSSSYGSAAASSLSGSITGLCDASNATPLLHACATSRTAAGMRQSPKNAVAMRRPPTALLCRPSWNANVSDLVVALVNATALARLVLQTRPHPPTHTTCWGGFIRQLQPRWRERPHFVARWCHQLRPPRWHRLLPPSYPLLFLVTWYVLHQGEGPHIHSECLLHHGSARDASHVLIVYASVMALVLSIKWSLFFVDNVIGLALPTNLLVMDGIKRGGRGDFFSRSTRLTLLQFFSSSEDCFFLG